MRSGLEARVEGRGRGTLRPYGGGLTAALQPGKNTLSTGLPYWEQPVEDRMMELVFALGLLSLFLDTAIRHPRVILGK
jgi:hypothetical protein